MRGETLQSAGDPLIEWLRRALEPGGGSVELSGAWLTPASSDPAAPAHAILRTRTSAAVEPVSVLLAESWWAQEFPVPSFPEIRRWLMRSASWVVIGHFVRRLYLRWMAPIIDIVRAVTGWIPWFGATALYEAVVYLIVGAAFAVVTVPFVCFVQFTAGLLSALSFIPVFGIAEWVSSLTRRLASVLGDSYVFTNRHVARAAVVERVSRDLDWLAGQCERVAVVAHSQGAAVSFQALERGVPPQLALWITYGAGIRKLLELEEFQKLAGYVRYAWAFVLAAAIATPLALPGWHAAWRPDSESLGHAGARPGRQTAGPRRGGVRPQEPPGALSDFVVDRAGHRLPYGSPLPRHRNRVPSDPRAPHAQARQEPGVRPARAFEQPAQAPAATPSPGTGLAFRFQPPFSPSRSRHLLGRRGPRGGIRAGAGFLPFSITSPTGTTSTTSCPGWSPP